MVGTFVEDCQCSSLKQMLSQLNREGDRRGQYDRVL
jgi:hypothetical protein